MNSGQPPGTLPFQEGQQLPTGSQILTMQNGQRFYRLQPQQPLRSNSPVVTTSQHLQNGQVSMTNNRPPPTTIAPQSNQPVSQLRGNSIIIRNIPPQNRNISGQSDGSGDSTANNAPMTEEENTKILRCQKFLKNLHSLAKNKYGEGSQKTKTIMEMIKELIDGIVSPADFSSRLREFLNSTNSNSNVNLVPFLEQAIPLIRRKLATECRQKQQQQRPNLQNGNQQQVVQQRPPSQQAPVQNHDHQVPIRPIKTEAQPVQNNSNMQQNNVKREYFQPMRQSRMLDDEEEDNNNIAGVNIERECNDLLQSSYSIITGDMKNCEDLSLLNTDALRIRVTNQVIQKSKSKEQQKPPSSSPDSKIKTENSDDQKLKITSEALNYLALINEQMIRNMVDKIILTAQHRNVSLQHEGTYTAVNNTKKQLEVFNKVNETQRKRIKEVNKENLLQHLKKRKTNNPEDSDLREQAKSLQERENDINKQMRMNDAASIAIGNSRKHVVQKNVRPPVEKKVRISLRDALYVLEDEPDMNQEILFSTYVKPR